MIAAAFLGQTDAMATSDLSLVLLAAGNGSRYGGPKQLAPVGPNGEPVFAVTAASAAAAGFSRLVVVTRHDLESPLRAAVAEHVKSLEVTFVFQDDAGPYRERPWGTGHAVAAAASVLDGPFGVANGDDLYGDPSIAVLAESLRSNPDNTATIVSFPLHRVLSEHGGVSRGVCTVAPDSRLISIVETHGIAATGEHPGAAIVTADGDELAPDTEISMSLWGLPAWTAGELAKRFDAFLAQHRSDARLEFQLPTELDRLRAEGALTIEVRPSDASWLGLTYKEDLDPVRGALAQWLEAAG